MKQAPRHLCLAVCAPGVESLTEAELALLDVRVRRTLRGGVEFSATDRQLYAANLWLRTANRIIVRVARYEAATFDALERGAGEVAWDAWIPDGTVPTVRVSATSSRLHHTDAVAERLAAVMARGTEPGPLVIARLIHDRVLISVDSSGEPLYRRGWRRSPASAPIRETLAAALVLASGWDCAHPLADPMCGSGTIAIEAALLASGQPPGRDRRFAFQDWPSFAPGTWASVSVLPEPKPVPAIVAADHDPDAVAASTANAELAGVGALIDVRRAALSKFVPPAGAQGWLVTNPPYGKRVAPGRDLRDLFAALGTLVRDRMAGWHVALLVADERIAGHAGIDLHERLRTENGGIPVRILTTSAGTVAA
ncbi:MAG: THUMP domain-containing class I SAM-dependent RNA methyltransferase [Acidimicrobiales bacterium]